MYYKRYELQWRLNLFFSASILAGAVSGVRMIRRLEDIKTNKHSVAGLWHVLSRWGPRVFIVALDLHSRGYCNCRGRVGRETLHCGLA